ncbi:MULTISPECIES: curli assembly protein CsgF [unclassified Caballeronia]|uniref:curli assembly protein CsgF n=1 Tax=unclassified Caballeronia TaxID=2646786 RepID=UPI00286189DF|nr:MULTISPECIES: curli assembly protein CsgF [unclassified Caballeronia]MDR5817085.1 curli assembly protein CsgF [Caballeronia sp. LZ033]MDR5823992.1 curli assembly protein CsgF [Caballeronia sp. LZ043]MDR5881888.1 curli assembly protein CsgF [Caballeronia sp. LZ032]
MKTNALVRRAVLACALTLPLAAAHATQLVYEPVNPNFGGSPLNGTNLLNEANAQNKYKDPSLSDLGSSQSTLDQFNNQLQQAILSRVASSISSSIVGADGTLHPGTINTGNFSIAITQVTGGNLQVTTTDKTSGASTTFVVGNGQ